MGCPHLLSARLYSDRVSLHVTEAMDILLHADDSLPSSSQA